MDWSQLLLEAGLVSVLHSAPEMCSSIHVFFGRFPKLTLFQNDESKCICFNRKCPPPPHMNVSFGGQLRKRR